jgi:energy-coupling factor transporter ATP-binding protein EcfA2
VADVLAMTVEEALVFLSPKELRDYVLERCLEPLARVGLGYLPLGQPLSTLSGGEAQRLKLARALSEPPKGTLFVVDEPSAGLHAEDAEHVVRALRQLVADFAPDSGPAERWRMLATRKLAELDESAARLRRMRKVLRTALDCGCVDLEECAPILRQGNA